MGSTLEVPNLTIDDLYAFRLRNFPWTFPAVSIARPLDELECETDGDDDALGYYPDGAKRTLTDEQIDMFRHSEIYSLLRERQRLKENHEDETGSSPWVLPLSKESDGNEMANLQQEIESIPGEDDGSDDEEEYLKFLEMERKDMEFARGCKKRKFSQLSGRNTHDRPSTHRRIARELDDAVLHNDELDYDDEPSETKAIPETTSVETLSNVHASELDARASEFQTTNPSPTQHPSPPREGRKIWWPTIRA